VGIILIGFIGHSYYKDSRDEAFLSCAIICFIISFLWTLAIVINVMPDSDLVKKLVKLGRHFQSQHSILSHLLSFNISQDLFFHAVAFVFYFFTILFFTISLIKYSTGKYRSTYRLWERVIAFVSIFFKTRNVKCCNKFSIDILHSSFFVWKDTRCRQYMPLWTCSFSDVQSWEDVNVLRTQMKMERTSWVRM